MNTDPGHRPSLGARVTRALRNTVLSLVIVGLAGMTGYALSTINSRTYTLQVVNGQLVVFKGRMLPWGAEPWQPADPRLADMYAPLDLEGNTPVGVTAQKYTDRDELDRALFGVMELLARPRVASDSPKDLQKGLYFVKRAERLPGLTEDQKDSVKRLQAEVSFYIARTRLEDAQTQVEEALNQLRIAAKSESHNARAANQMLLALEAPAKALSDAMRLAVHSLSEPAGAPPNPPAAPLVPAPSPSPAGAAPTAPTPAPAAPPGPAPTPTTGGAETKPLPF